MRPINRKPILPSTSAHDDRDPSPAGGGMPAPRVRKNRSNKRIKAGLHMVKLADLWLPKTPGNDNAVLDVSVADIGVLQPILVTTDGEVISGVGRVRAAKASGVKTIEATVKNIPPERRTCLRHESNYAVVHRSYPRKCIEVAEWKDELAKDDPDGVRGKAGARARWRKADAKGKVAVASTIAKSAGLSARTIRRMARVAGAIPRDVLEELDRLPTIRNSPAQVHALAKHKGDPAFQREVVRLIKTGEAKAVRDAVSFARVDRIRKNPPPTPTGRYKILMIDPPWTCGGGVHAPYATMTVNDIIEKTPVKDLEDDDSIIILWATGDTLPDAFRVLTEWGYTYRGMFVWHKANSNTGRFFRTNNEFALLATRGDKVPAFIPDVCKATSTIHTTVKGRHSKKPDEFFARIDELYPNGSRIEVYARDRRPTTPGVVAWDGWGDEWAGRVDRKTHKAA
jgi:N6-adenosine-specific RNA methylase IME4/ParB-like chromosome segregation protein Spo0J